MEASSKSWINRSQQWHNLPVTSVGLVIYRLPFEEGTVQEKSSSHHTQLPSYLRNNWPRLLPHSSRFGTKQEVSNAAGSRLLMERVGSGSNWLGKDFFQKAVLRGEFRMAGTSPRGSPLYRPVFNRDRNQTRSSMLSKGNTHQAFPSSPGQWDSDNTEVLASSDQAGLLDSLANAGESSQIGGLVLRGGYCSRLLRLFALR